MEIRHFCRFLNTVIQLHKRIYNNDQIDLYKIENSKIAQFMCRDVKAIMSCMHDAGEKKTKVI